VSSLLTVSPKGLYCEAGAFHIDPWCPVERALITHAHSDHVCAGSANYLSVTDGVGALRARIGDSGSVESLRYGEMISTNGVHVSFHPAGHILGSAQIRLEHQGEVWVVSGDYKLDPDPTCTPFEEVRCHVFVTESTFGLPIYRWRAESEIFAEIGRWWQSNRETGKASVLFVYPLGKAQRVLAGLNEPSGMIFTHGAVERYNRIYREIGVRLPETIPVSLAPPRTDWSRALILAPPSCNGSPWLRRFGRISTGFVSGWMRIRGARRRRSLDRGFVLSDHADWPALTRAIDGTGAARIWVTHGYRAPLVRWLTERGLEAVAVETRFEGEQDESGTESVTEPEP